MSKKLNDIFESEFDLTKIDASASVNILPKIEFNDGIEQAKIIQIKGTYYTIDLPDDKKINKEKVKALNMLYENTLHYFIAESESFRFQIDVIRRKKNLLKMSDIDGLMLKVWTEEKFLNTPKFRGKGKVYCVQAL